jgi:hypothetical protein
VSLGLSGAHETARIRRGGMAAGRTRAANGDAGRCLSVVTTTSDPADLLSNSKINAVELKAYRDGCTIIDGGTT